MAQDWGDILRSVQGFAAKQILAEEKTDIGEDNEDYVENMFRTEETIANAGLTNQLSSRTTQHPWLPEVRHTAIHYIVHTGGPFGVKKVTVYTAVVYFDRFLSSMPIQFIRYFLSRFCRDLSRTMYAKSITVELIMSILGDVRLMSLRAFVVGAAATLLASNSNILTHELIRDEINALPQNWLIPLILIGRELATNRLNDQQVEGLVNDNWNQQIRTRAIRYIRRAGRIFQFSRRTLYRSVIYLDRFLAYRVIANGQLWAVRLIAVACLSLSAKMNDNIDDVPPLSDYPVGAYNISVNAIQRMEILVLVDFNWNMNCVTPFDFRIFFVSRFCRDVTRLDITRITTARIIMSALRDLRLMNHRPSVVAAAATLVAVNRNFTIQELVIEINVLPINGFLQIADVSYCYNRMLELNI
ncbi:hypothetical protein KY289_021668 [Solanum tuberosum]|nr:hypothetical protein KY289_021668 [Solanum tuberosum]